jgi:multidrug efflux pump subunit AcrA (membrane-fusion protein)
MNSANGGERALLCLGLVPLLAGAVWLVALRTPQPVAAHASPPRAAAFSDERSAPLPSEPAALGVVVAGQDAALGAELAGQVTAVFAEPGARVRRGEPLVQLASISVLGARGMADAQLAQDRSSEQAAELALRSAHDKLERIERALAAHSAAEQSDARAEAERAAAELSKLRATSQLQRAGLQRELARADKQIVRAPFDGVLASRWVDRGDFVTVGTPLARVVDHARFVRFAVPAGAHVRLAAGARLRVTALAGTGLAAAAQSPIATAALHARLTNVEPELDAAAGLGFARAELDAQLAEAAGLAPGARVQVYPAGTETGSLQP